MMACMLPLFVPVDNQSATDMQARLASFAAAGRPGNLLCIPAGRVQDRTSRWSAPVG